MGRAQMDERKRIAAAIKDHLARERISRKQFAFKTKLGKSTVDKLLIGLFSDKTLAIVESHTNLPLRLILEDRPAADRRPAAKPLTPSIAVLPFTNMGGAPEQDFFADGITEDIITALARLRWLFVIARNSTCAHNKAGNVRQVARDLGVRYVLGGSVRAAGTRLRITGQLIDAESGKHIWAEKYDREVRDIFAVQDDITERIVAAVAFHLDAEEGFQGSNRRPDSIDDMRPGLHASSFVKDASPSHWGANCWRTLACARVDMTAHDRRAARQRADAFDQPRT